MHCIITEKDTAARRIAAILSGGNARARKIYDINVYEFGDTVVIGLKGHIFQFDFPKEYRNWSRIDPYELINADLVAVPLRKNVVKALEHIAKRASIVTIATDYDREGELIGVEALGIVRRVNPSVAVDRMRFSAITERDIKESFAHRTAIDKNLAASAEAREVIDLIWGASLSRFVSLAAKRLGSDFFSVGRVQSPALALLVDREREISEFVPKKYWEIHARLITEKGDVLNAKIPVKFWERDKAERSFSKIKNAALAEVSEIREKERRVKPPTPFDTTSFIRAAGYMGFSPKKAMNIAESLYLRGLISYHRTDNTTYPPTIDLREKVKMLTRIDALRKHALKILSKKQLKPTAGKKKTTDHPPIHPVSVPDENEMGAAITTDATTTGSSATTTKAANDAKDAKDGLSRDEWRIYELVARRFLSTLSEDAVWKDTVVKISAGGETLEARGKELKEEGFLAVYPYARKKEEHLPQLSRGEHLKIEKVEIVEKETEPPKRISQASLIKEMEKLGIGTKSTRHEIISKLYERKYLSGDPAKPTEKALSLIDLLRKYAEVITKPDMTRQLEEEMEKIAQGVRSKDDVINASREMLKRVFEQMKKNRDEIGEALREGAMKDECVGACPECGASLYIRHSRRGKRFLSCERYPECIFSLPLPAHGRIIVTDEKCEEHPTFFKLEIKSGRKKRNWKFGCPYCNFLRWKDEKH